MTHRGPFQPLTFCELIHVSGFPKINAPVRRVLATSDAVRFLLLPFQSLCIAFLCSMHLFPRAFCEGLSCLEAEGVDSIHAFPVTNSILFWFGLPIEQE